MKKIWWYLIKEFSESDFNAINDGWNDKVVRCNKGDQKWGLYIANKPGAYNSEDFQKFLDHQQYSRNGILRYEQIFGQDYVSTGGAETSEEFVAMLNLKEGQKVLDVGCGIGGSAFLMRRKYGAHVQGIDLSKNMIDIANERAAKYNLR